MILNHHITSGTDQSIYDSIVLTGIESGDTLEVTKTASYYNIWGAYLYLNGSKYNQYTNSFSYKFSSTPSTCELKAADRFGSGTIRIKDSSGNYKKLTINSNATRP